MLPPEKIRVPKLGTPFVFRCSLIQYDYSNTLINSPGREYKDGRLFSHNKFVRPENCTFKLEYLMKMDGCNIE